MKKLFVHMVTAGLLAAASAQTSTSTSASGGASVSPRQTNAGANAGQAVQAPGASANANVSSQGQISADSKPKRDSDSKSGAPAGSSASLSSGTTLQAELTKPVDAKKARPGDEVTGKLTQDVKVDGKVVARKGSRVVGHVSEAHARTKEQTNSRLGIVFDKLILSGGQELAFSGVVQALAPPVHTALAASEDETSGLSGPPSAGGPAQRSGGSLVGGVTSTATAGVSSTTRPVGGAAGGAVNGTVGGVANTAEGLSAQGALTGASHGVIGLQGLALEPATSGSAQGSVISSASRNVRLDSGTQMLLQVTGSAQ